MAQDKVTEAVLRGLANGVLECSDHAFHQSLKFATWRHLSERDRNRLIVEFGCALLSVESTFAELVRIERQLATVYQVDAELRRLTRVVAWYENESLDSIETQVDDTTGGAQ